MLLKIEYTKSIPFLYTWKKANNVILIYIYNLLEKYKAPNNTTKHIQDFFKEKMMKFWKFWKILTITLIKRYISCS